jgi:hypothetical protein
MEIEVMNMRRIKKITMEELVSENKKMLLNDKSALEKIEEKVEKKRLSRI